MPALSDPATWRKRFSYTGYLWIDKPAVVYSARVNQIEFTYPISEITFDTGTGTLGDVLPGMLVLIGSAAGLDDRGRTFVRKAPTADTLYIGRSSEGKIPGSVYLANDLYITILDTFLPFELNEYTQPTGDVLKNEDLGFATYGDDGLNPPVANAGIYYAQFVDGDDEITVDFNGSNSFATEPGESISAYAWTFPGATPSSSASATVNDVVFGPGRRWVELEVTANAQTHTARALVVGAEASGANAPILAEIQPQELRLDEHRVEFRVNQALSRSDYVLGTVVIYWEDERYADVSGSLAGPADREHIKFVGYLESTRNVSRATPQGVIKETIVTCVDITGWLKKLRAPGVVMKHLENPVRWGEMNTPTIDRFIHYQLNWHSTVLSIADWHRTTTGTTYVFTDWEAGDGTLFDQCKELAGAIRHDFTCDQRGRLLTTPVAQELDASGGGTTVARTTTEIVALLPTDYEDFEVDEVQSSVSILESSAYVASTTTKQKIYSRAPGEAPAAGTSPAKEDGYLVADETEHNVMTGHRWARLNPIYGHIHVTLVPGGDAGIIPGLGEWVDLTLDAAAATERGLTFTNIRCQVVSVSIQHNHKNGTKRQVLELEPETSGLPGQSFTIPSDGETPPNEPTTPSVGDPGRRNRIPSRNPYPNRPPSGPPVTQVRPDDPDDPLPNNPFPPGKGVGGGNYPIKLPFSDETAVAWDSDGLTLRLTKNLQSKTPSWTTITPELGVDFEIKQFIWSGFGVDGYVLASDGTTSKMFYCEDLSIAEPVWTQQSEIDGEYTAIRSGGLQGEIEILSLDAGSASPHIFDFSESDGGWEGLIDTAPTFPLPWGEYDSINGWWENLFQSDVDGFQSRIRIGIDFSYSSTITGVIATYDYLSGGEFDGTFSHGDHIAINGTSLVSDTTPPINGSGDNRTINSGVESFAVSPGDALRVELWVKRHFGGGGSNTGYARIKSISVSFTGVNPFTGVSVGDAVSRYSSDYGETFGSELAIGDVSTSVLGFDSVPRSSRTLSSTDTQPRLSGASGGAYGDYGTTLPSGAVPTCIVVPRIQFGTESGNNSATSTPEYLLASSTDASGEAMWKVTGSGNTFTAITPNDGSNDGLAVSPNCVWIPWKSGDIIAAILDFDGTRKLVVSETAGISWNVKASLGANADYIRTPKNAPESLFWCDEKLYYSPDLGTTRYKKSYPATIGGIAPYG